MVESSVRHHNKLTIWEGKVELQALLNSSDGLGIYIFSPVRLAVWEVVLPSNNLHMY